MDDLLGKTWMHAKLKKENPAAAPPAEPTSDTVAKTEESLTPNPFSTIFGLIKARDTTNDDTDSKKAYLHLLEKSTRRPTGALSGHRPNEEKVSTETGGGVQFSSSEGTKSPAKQCCIRSNSAQLTTTKWKLQNRSTH